MRCPGQDPRYWTEDAVFEVPCPECGAAVEFFKDETAGRCSKCGQRFRNPGIDFGCAQWCSLAEQCLGFVPERAETAEPREGALAGRLLREIKEAFAGDAARLARSLRAFHFAKELVSKEGGDPRVALAAALLLPMGPAPCGAESAAPGEQAPRAKQILEQTGADEDTVRRVLEIVAAHHAAKGLDSVEFRVVEDAHTLAGLTARNAGDDIDELRRGDIDELRRGDIDELRRGITDRFKTETARQRARMLLQPPGAEPKDEG